MLTIQLMFKEIYVRLRVKAKLNVWSKPNEQD